jgi:Tfp pilus assembly protein PilN
MINFLPWREEARIHKHLSYLKICLTITSFACFALITTYIISLKNIAILQTINDNLNLQIKRWDIQYLPLQKQKIALEKFNHVLLEIKQENANQLFVINLIQSITHLPEEITLTRLQWSEPKILITGKILSQFNINEWLDKLKRAYPLESINLENIQINSENPGEMDFEIKMTPLST